MMVDLPLRKRVTVGETGMSGLIDMAALRLDL